jgi:hypothetical protein
MTTMQYPLLEDPLEVQFSEGADDDDVEKNADKPLGVLKMPKDLAEIKGDVVCKNEENLTTQSSTLTDTIIETKYSESSADVVEPDDKVGGALELPEETPTGNKSPSQPSEENVQVGGEESMIQLEDSATQNSNAVDETEPAKTDAKSSTAHDDKVRHEDDATEAKMVVCSDQLKEGHSSFSANDLLASEDAAPAIVSPESLKDEPLTESAGNVQVEEVGSVSAPTSSTRDKEKTDIIPPPDAKPNEMKGTQKMKLQVVNSDGKFTLMVTGDKAERSQESKSNEARPMPRDKSNVKQTKSGDKTSVGGKQRNKVISPITPKPGQPRTAPQKPLMDLRHILKKHEKKTEAVVQPIQQVDFYGSMSAIPFLKRNKPEDKKKKKKELKPKVTASDKEEIIDSADKEPDEYVVEKRKLPTKEEITVTAEYDEAQLHLWKSMSALDSQLGSVERPQEMLPLRPGIRQKKKKEPSKNSVRAFSRPEDWINRPEMRSPKGGILFMEPKDSQDGQPPPPPLGHDNASSEQVVDASAGESPPGDVNGLQ